jgi:hypothetical protein
MADEDDRRDARPTEPPGVERRHLVLELDDVGSPLLRDPFQRRRKSAGDGVRDRRRHSADRRGEHAETPAPRLGQHARRRRDLHDDRTARSELGLDRRLSLPPHVDDRNLVALDQTQHELRDHAPAVRHVAARRVRDGEEDAERSPRRRLGLGGPGSRGVTYFPLHV